MALGQLGGPYVSLGWPSANVPRDEGRGAGSGVSPQHSSEAALTLLLEFSCGIRRSYAPRSWPETTCFFLFFFFSSFTAPLVPLLCWCPREALPSRTTRKSSLLSGNASGEPNDDDSCQPRFRGADSRGGVWGRLARSKTRRTSELCSCHLSRRMRAGAAHGVALACVTSVTFEMYGGSDGLQDGGIS